MKYEPDKTSLSEDQWNAIMCSDWGDEPYDEPDDAMDCQPFDAMAQG